MPKLITVVALQCWKAITASHWLKYSFLANSDDPAAADIECIRLRFETSEKHTSTDSWTITTTRPHVPQAPLSSEWLQLNCARASSAFYFYSRTACGDAPPPAEVAHAVVSSHAPHGSYYMNGPYRHVRTPKQRGAHGWQREDAEPTHTQITLHE